MRKWIYIGLAFAFLAAVLLIAKCNDEAEVVVQEEFVPKKEQTIEVAKRNTLDSIALERAMDSIQILNNMIANNVQKMPICFPCRSHGETPSFCPKVFCLIFLLFGAGKRESSVRKWVRWR